MLIAKQIHAHQAGVQVQPAGAHGVVVIPEHGRVLPVRVVADARLAGWVPVFRIAVVCRGRTATVQMDHGARLRQLPAGAMEAVVDGKEMPRRQLIMPLDRQLFVTAGFEQWADRLWSVAPQPGRRKIAVHLHANLTHGDMASRPCSGDSLGRGNGSTKGSSCSALMARDNPEAGCWLMARPSPARKTRVESAACLRRSRRFSTA